MAYLTFNWEKPYCVQKSAGILITLTGKYEHISPTFIAHHWFPIKEKCKFNILLTYKCCNGVALAYIEELLDKRHDLAATMTICSLFQTWIVTFGELHSRKQLLNSRIAYLLYIRAKPLQFLNMGWWPICSKECLIYSRLFFMYNTILTILKLVFLQYKNNADHVFYKCTIHSYFLVL